MSTLSTDTSVSATHKQQFEALFPRLLHFGVAYADARRISDAAESWEQWSELIAAVGREYEALAREARLRGSPATAAWAWRRATDYYHFAQLRLLHGPVKELLLQQSRTAFACLAPLLIPPAVPIAVPLGGSTLPGYVRIAAPRAPMVLLIGGLDSSKEVELSSFGDWFLERGLSVCFFDGPGQGENCGRLPMTPTFERAVSTVIDWLQNRADVDAERLGVFGVSFGGYLACRAAAADERLRACVSLGGFFDLRIFTRLSPLATSTLQRSLGLQRPTDLEQAVRNISLEPLRNRMDRPLLIVHGRADMLVEESQARAIHEWATGPTELWLIENAEHVCTNKFGTCLPRVGDWLVGQLGLNALRSGSSHQAGNDEYPESVSLCGSLT